METITSDNRSEEVKIYVFDNFVTETKGKISSYLGEGFRESDYDSEGQGRPKRDVIEFNTRHYLLCRDARLSTNHNSLQKKIQ